MVIPEWAQYISAFTALLVSGGFVNFLIGLYLDRKKRIREEIHDKNERATRLQLFALEGVELQDRWVQYARQSMGENISRSSPYELTNAEQVNELINAGMNPSIVESIYYIKEVTNDVRRLVLQAQEGHFRLMGLPPDMLNQMTPTQRAEPKTIFNSATAFISGRWDRTKKAVDEILMAAEAHGCSIGHLKSKSTQNCKEFEELKPKLKVVD